MTETARSLYLSGEHEPVTDELTVATLEVKGELPRELHGLYVRNSPNPQFAPSGKYHWFDGDGMVHGVRFSGSGASYVNRWVRTAGFEAERTEGHALWSGILEPVAKNPRAAPLKDTANTDLVFHNGKLLSLWWLSGTPYSLSTKDLSTLGPETFGGKLTGGFSAHPKVDPRTNELVFFDHSLIRTPHLRYGVVSSTGELVRYEAVDIPTPHIFHDMAITENYSVLLDFPLGWDRAKLKEGKLRIGFERATPTRFGVLPRLGTAKDVRWFEAKPCYAYHTVNAYEEGDELVLIMCRVADPIPEKQETSGKVARLDIIELVPTMYRWRLNLKSGAVREEQLDDVPTEFPRVHDGLQGLKVRYSYNPRIAPRPDLMFDGFVKYDLQTGAKKAFSYPSGWFGGEGAFVPRPGALSEDDGWLISYATNAAERASSCFVLDAKELTTVAEVRLPRRIPIGFHSYWVP